MALQHYIFLHIQVAYSCLGLYFYSNGTSVCSVDVGFRCTSKGLMISTKHRRSWSVLSVSCRLVMEGFFVEQQMGRFIKRIWTVILDNLLVWWVAGDFWCRAMQSMIDGHSFGTVIWKDEWGLRNFIMPWICFFLFSTETWYHKRTLYVFVILCLQTL